jgi:hypothetical protein
MVLFWSVFFCLNSFALEGGEYQTPNTWKRHYSVGGIKYSAGSVAPGGAEVALTAASRTVYRYFEDSLTEEFAYLRLKAGNIEAAGGDIAFNLYLRGGYASEKFEPETFSASRNGFYAERKDDLSALRVYQGNAVFEDIIPLTAVTLGRQYLSHIDTQLADGGNIDVSLFKKRLTLHALYALPVSFYATDPHTYIYGGGADASPSDFLRIRAEYQAYDDRTQEYRNDVIKARIDGKIPPGNLYLNYKRIDSANDIQAGAILDFKPVVEGLGGTVITASARTITDSYGEEVTLFLDPYSTSLGQEGKNTILAGEISQGIREWLAVSIGGEGKIIAGDADYAHRDFSRVYASIDLNGVFSPTIYIKISGDIWTAPKDGNLKEESTFQIGGEISWSLGDFALWGGTNFQKYRYYYPEEERTVFLAPSLKRFEEDARTFYLGGEYTLSGTGLTIGADISVVSSSVYSAYNNDFNDSMDTRAELMLNWVL